MQCKFSGKFFIFVCVWVLPVSFKAIKVCLRLRPLLTDSFGNGYIFSVFETE